MTSVCHFVFVVGVSFCVAVAAGFGCYAGTGGYDKQRPGRRERGWMGGGGGGEGEREDVEKGDGGRVSERRWWWMVMKYSVRV